METRKQIYFEGECCICGVYSVNENCYPFLHGRAGCMAVAELQVREDVYPPGKPFRMRNITLTFPIAHAHTCLLETGGATDILPFKPAVALWLTLFFRIFLWIDTLVPNGLRIVKEWIFASVIAGSCPRTASSCSQCLLHLITNCWWLWLH